MPRFFLVWLIFCFALGQLFKFPFFLPSVSFTLLDLWTLSFLLYFLVGHRKEVVSLLKSQKTITTSIFLFIFWSLFCLLVAGSRYGTTAQLVGLLYLVRWSIYTLTFLGLQKVYSKPTLNKLLLSLGLVTALVGFVQYLFFPDIRTLAVYFWDPHYYRVVGSLLDPGFTGLLCVFTLILLTQSKVTISNHVRKLCWLFVFIVLALTYSRSSYLALFISSIYISYLQKSIRYISIVSILILIAIIVLPRPGGEGVKLERTSSIQARVINWTNSLIIVKDNPFIGVGFNTYRYAQKEYNFVGFDWQDSHAAAGADSSLLFVAATTGIGGFVIYLVYLIQLAKTPQTKLLLVPLLLHSIFLNSLFYPFILIWLSISKASDS